MFKERRVLNEQGKPEAKVLKVSAIAVSQLVAPAHKRRAKSTVGAAGRACQTRIQASPRLCPPH